MINIVSCGTLRYSIVEFKCTYKCIAQNKIFSYSINLNGNYYLLDPFSNDAKGVYKTLTSELYPYSPRYKHKYFDFYCAQKNKDAYHLVAESFEIKGIQPLKQTSISYLFREYKEIEKKTIHTQSGHFRFNNLVYNYVSINLIDDKLLHRFTFFCDSSQHSYNDLFNEAVSQVVTFKTLKEDVRAKVTQPADTSFFHTYNYYSKIAALQSGINLDNEDVNNTLISNYYSFLGMDDSAKYYNEIRYNKYRAVGNSLPTTQNGLKAGFNKYSLADFVNDSRVSASNILILNEAHHLNINRDVARLLLPLIKDRGYNYFAVEGVINPMSIDLFKMPSFKSGYYLQSRSYANLVDDAIKLGFKVISYDDTSNVSWKSREFNQAQNLFNKTFATDSNAKVFVYCGYDHGRKDTATNKYFAHHFQNLAGKSAISVRQTLYYNHFFEWNNNHQYLNLLSQHKDETPFVISYNSFSNKYDFDIVIPNTSKVIFKSDTTINLIYKIAEINYRYLLVFNDNEFKYLGSAAVPLMIKSREELVKQKYLLGVPNVNLVLFLLDENFNMISSFYL